jgi:hypothetical protein
MRVARLVRLCTPAMAVHGRYTVPSSDGMLEVVNQLVGAIRKNK